MAVEDRSSVRRLPKDEWERVYQDVARSIASLDVLFMLAASGDVESLHDQTLSTFIAQVLDQMRNANKLLESAGTV